MPITSRTAAPTNIRVYSMLCNKKIIFILAKMVEQWVWLHGHKRLVRIFSVIAKIKIKQVPLQLKAI